MAAYQLTEVTPDHEQIVSLYASVGWTNYSGDRDHLIASIEGSQYVVYAVDDGINATAKTPMDVIIEVRGGDIAVAVANGDTDGFDSNGDLFIYGGNIEVTAQSSFDADGTAQLVGGSVTINGTAVSELPAS